MEILKTKLGKIALGIFLTIELALYILIEVAPIEGATIYFEYSSVFLCFVFALLFFKKENIFIYLGLLFTCCADHCLVLGSFGDYWQIIGMSCFSLTQICYFVHLFLRHENKRMKIVDIVLRVFLLACVYIVVFFTMKDKIDAVLIVSAFYLVNLFINILSSFCRTKKNWLLSIGLVCFICCDIFVALTSGVDSGYISMDPNSGAYNFLFETINLAWIFYVPSQVLISLSTLTKEK